ncbi:hypothetical protein WJX75_008084 [Coccomyxa subellipsoidea]|uniref:Alpha-1,3-glucosyltransferase n=1 Tax=Coccomyxa subellipsoidea TaxID=248742 RepID=A0ABR2Z0Y3_9CHLO
MLLNGLLIEDNIHFQYNGFLKGILIWSVALIPSFRPFILARQLEQVLGRLFPFNKGLMHAYWAANMWALYAAADRALALLLLRFGFPVEKASSLMTGGLVQVSSFAVLPDIGAGTTLVVVLISMAPMLIRFWRNPRPNAFASAAAYACICSFMAGYHCDGPLRPAAAAVYSKLISLEGVAVWHLITGQSWAAKQMSGGRWNKTRNSLLGR